MIVPQRSQLDLALNRANGLRLIKTSTIHPGGTAANAVAANLIQTIAVSILH